MWRFLTSSAGDSGLKWKLCQVGHQADIYSFSLSFAQNPKETNQAAQTTVSWPSCISFFFPSVLLGFTVPFAVPVPSLCPSYPLDYIAMHDFDPISFFFF